MSVPVAAPTARGGYAKGRARRGQIVTIATRQFAERGFDNATILEIAAACGISRTGLLHYFPTKESLLEAVLEDRDVQDRVRFRPYRGVPGGVGILRGMIDLANHNRLVPGLIQLFVRLSVEAAHEDHPAHEYFVSRYERIRAGTTLALQAAAAAGYLAEGVDPTEAAARLTALMDGLQAQWLIDHRVDMQRHIRSAILELLTPAGVSAMDNIQPRSEI